MLELFCPLHNDADVSSGFQGGILSVLASLGMMFWLAMTPHNSETEKKRLAILAGFAFFTGEVQIRDRNQEPVPVKNRS